MQNAEGGTSNVPLNNNEMELSNFLKADEVQNRAALIEKHNEAMPSIVENRPYLSETMQRLKNVLNQLTEDRVRN